MRIWIVVADEREALFYDAGGEKGGRDRGRSAAGLRLVRRINNPQAHWDRGLEESRPRSGFTTDTDRAHGVESERRSRRSDQEYFASRIGEEIDRAQQADSFDRLVLGAAPGILRLIRGTLSTASRELVAAEVAKDVMCCDEEELLAQLVPEPLPRPDARH